MLPEYYYYKSGLFFIPVKEMTGQQKGGEYKNRKNPAADG